jgi:hypothetical protein
MIMSNVKVLFTAKGPILADVIADDDHAFILENPVYVVPGQQGIVLMPILAMTQQTKLRLEKSEVEFCEQLFEPQLELRNYYSGQYGSGIQLLTESKSLSSPR